MFIELIDELWQQDRENILDTEELPSCPKILYLKGTQSRSRLLVLPT